MHISLWQKIRRAYKQHRTVAQLRRRDRKFVRKAEAFVGRYPQLPFASPLAHGKPRVVFSHAGNAGDVIFSLPTLRVLSQGRPARLLLRTGSPAFYAEGVHPLGAVQLDAATVRMMTPLLEAQTYIESADVLGEADVVDCRLDLFRDAPLPGDKGSIARWYFYCFGVFADLSQPWLKVEPDTNYSDTIVISRSQRYRNPTLDHRVLARYPKLAFIGVDAEFDEMRALLPKLERVPVPDFLAMARAIAGARLFIGNQSLPYSIAEALKARRLLEACPRVPTNVPEGAYAFEAWFQPHFEALVEKIYAMPG